MGSVLSCRSSMSFHTTVQTVQADASVLTAWEVRSDVDNFLMSSPDHIVVTQLLSKGKDRTKLGMKWRETRMYDGKTLHTIHTVTAVSEKPLSATYSVQYVGERWQTSAGNQTGTFSVISIDESSCQLVLTVNFVSDGLWGITMKLCGFCIKRYAVNYQHSEMEVFAAEAMKRERAKRVPDADKRDDDERQINSAHF